MKKTVFCLALCLLALSGCSNSERSIETNINGSLEATSSISSKGQMTTKKSKTSITKKNAITNAQFPDNVEKTPANVTETTKAKSEKATRAVQTKTKRTTTATKDNTWEYLQAIQKENDRYNEAIQEIDRKYDIKVETQRSGAEQLEINIRRSCGPRPSENLYDVEEQIKKAQNKVSLYSMDGSGMYEKELAKAQEELDELFRKQRSILMWQKLDEEQMQTKSTIERLNVERDRIKEAEKENHNTNISKINEKYSK